ncbi:uncharacterized protein LOC133778425 isoform X2 [Humulus lupulus]|nr:uncharacterized protein LOC133778425 isoform X2 [Humulus lupulus]
MANENKLRREDDSMNEKQIHKKYMHSTSEHGHLGRNHGKASGTDRGHCHVPMHSRIDSAKQKQLLHKNAVAKIVDKVESGKGIGKKARLKKRRGCGCKNIDFVNYDELNKINPQLLKANDVAEAIVNQKFIEGKYLNRDGINQQSNQLLDALEILNSNKNLFTKLLQDPNSLLVKHIQELRDCQEQQQQTKSSSQNSTTCDDPQSSDTIVVLKPGSTSLQDSSSDKINHCSSPKYCHGVEKHVQSVRPAYFSLGHIKRKFKHAMGVARKDQDLMSIDGVQVQNRSSSPTEDGNKGKGTETIRRNFRIENKEVEDYSFDIAKRDKIAKLKDFKARIGQETASRSESAHENSNLSNFSHPKRSESRIYIEGRRHYYESELLDNKNEDGNFFPKEVPLFMQRTVSSPDYDLLPIQSPRSDIKTGFVTAQMRFSPYSYSQVAYENSWRHEKEHKSSYSSLLNRNIDLTNDNNKLNSQFQDVDEKLSDHAQVLEVYSSNRGQTNPVEFQCAEKNVDMEATNIRHSEETSSSMLSASDSSDDISTSDTSDDTQQKSTDLLDAPSQSCNTDKISTNQNTDTTNTDEENECFKCSRMDPLFEDQPSTCSTEVLPSTPSNSVRVEEDPDRIKDGGNQSSPISVLEQFFTDVSSPQSTMSQPASALMIPHLDTEVNITTSSNLYGSISEYVKAVLQASGLNWDDIDLKCHGSDPLLYSCLLDSSKCQSSQFCGDCKLIFDFISEVLLEVYDSHFRCSGGLSFIKLSIVHLLPVENFVNQEVMKRVGWHLQPHSSPRTMEQLIGNDLKRSETWLDIRADVVDIIGEMVEDTLDELVMETIDDMHSY